MSRSRVELHVVSRSILANGPPTPPQQNVTAGLVLVCGTKQDWTHNAG